MPFIPKDRREGALNRLHDEPGDRCFRHYYAFMQMWREESRWHTIDKYALRIWPEAEQRAAALALLVFMAQHGNAYEELAKKMNGDI